MPKKTPPPPTRTHPASNLGTHLKSKSSVYHAKLLGQKPRG